MSILSDSSIKVSSGDRSSSFGKTSSRLLSSSSLNGACHGEMATGMLHGLANLLHIYFEFFGHSWNLRLTLVNLSTLVLRIFEIVPIRFSGKRTTRLCSASAS